jgi:hypothetical protein
MFRKKERGSDVSMRPSGGTPDSFQSCDRSKQWKQYG